MTDRELEATDHLNKKMLEIYKRHLDNNTIRVPANAKICVLLWKSFFSSQKKTNLTCGVCDSGIG
jgi:hypothetical protein